MLPHQEGRESKLTLERCRSRSTVEWPECSSGAPACYTAWAWACAEHPGGLTWRSEAHASVRGAYAQKFAPLAWTVSRDTGKLLARTLGSTAKHLACTKGPALAESFWLFVLCPGNDEKSTAAATQPQVPFGKCARAEADSFLSKPSRLPVAVCCAGAVPVLCTASAHSQGPIPRPFLAGPFAVLCQLVWRELGSVLEKRRYARYLRRSQGPLLVAVAVRARPHTQGCAAGPPHIWPRQHGLAVQQWRLTAPILCEESLHLTSA